MRYTRRLTCELNSRRAIMAAKILILNLTWCPSNTTQDRCTQLANRKSSLQKSELLTATVWTWILTGIVAPKAAHKPVNVGRTSSEAVYKLTKWGVINAVPVCFFLSIVAFANKVLAKNNKRLNVESTNTRQKWKHLLNVNGLSHLKWMLGSYTTAAWLCLFVMCGYMNAQ